MPDVRWSGFGVQRLKDLARGSKGAKPTGKFRKKMRKHFSSGALWLATMRNLPNYPKQI